MKTGTIYLVAPPTTEARQDALLLELSGYLVRSMDNVLDPNDPWNHGSVPTGARLLQRQAAELLDCDVAVLHPTVHPDTAARFMALCHEMGVHLVHMHSLPAVRGVSMEWLPAADLARRRHRSNTFSWLAAGAFATLRRLELMARHLEGLLWRWTTNGMKRHRIPAHHRQVPARRRAAAS